MLSLQGLMRGNVTFIIGTADNTGVFFISLSARIFLPLL
jgi:hypothetical protein